MKTFFLSTVAFRASLRRMLCVGLFLAAVLALALPYAQAQTQTPMRPLTLTGYNADVIADGTSAASSTTVPLDRFNVYFAKGFKSFPANLGLPAGNTFASASNPNATFLIQPAAGVNNVLLLTDQANAGNGEVSSGTLTLAAPTSYSSLAVLVTGEDSSNPVSYTLAFADGTLTQGTFVAPDNVSGTGAVALSGFGRVVRATGALDTSEPSTAPILFEIDITFSADDAARTLTSITFANLCPDPFVGPSASSERKVAIFGVSGYSPSQAASQPVPVVGFTQDVIADPGTTASASTSTTLDTAYDYYAAGFNTAAPTVGLPAGGTFVSSSNPGTTFALQPAAGNNALLFTQSGTLTLAAPGAYTSLAVLETGLNGNVTVNYTLHFSDAGSPTIGTFIANDNGSSAAPALSGFGRVLRASNQADESQTINQPRLFEWDITLSATDALRPLASIEFANGSLFTRGAPQAIAVFGLSGLQTVIAPPVGEAAFSDSGYTVARAAGHATITVNRIGGSAGKLTVAYRTQDGTASALNGDYTAASGTLTWVDGDTAAKTFNVLVNAGASTPGDVDFLVALDPASGSEQPVGSPSLTTVNILNADASATPIQAVDILSPPPTGISVVQNQAVTLYTSVQAIQGVAVQTTYTASDDSGATPPAALTPDASDASKATWVPSAAGQFHLNVTAAAPDGQTVSASVPITVVAVDSSTDAGPQVALLGGVDGRQFAAGESITLAASAVNSDGTPLTSVQFYANNQSLGTASVVSFASRARGGKTRLDGGAVGAAYATLTFTLTAELAQLLQNQKSALVTAVGTNSSGISAVSAPVKVYAQSTLHTGLACSIAVPASGSDLPSEDSQQIVRVSATDSAGQVAEVDLIVDQRKAGTVTTAPYVFTLPPLAAGTHVISAIATDGNAVSATSNPTIVHAITSPPTVTANVIGDGMAIEGGEKGKAFIERTGDTSLPLTVYYKVKGTAVAGVDYKPLPGSVVIPAGASKIKVKIKPLTLETVPGTRKAKIKLLAPDDGSYILGDPPVAKIKVIANG